VNPDEQRKESVSDPRDLAKPATADIWVMNSDGSSRTNLTRSRFLSVQPVWSHDGSIYFVTNRAKNGVENIWAVKPDKPMGPDAMVATPQPAPESPKSEMKVMEQQPTPHAQAEPIK